MSRPKLLVVALWVIHTHCVQHIEQTPYLAVTSPEKQCGKSRLLETLELLDGASVGDGAAFRGRRLSHRRCADADAAAGRDRHDLQPAHGRSLRGPARAAQCRSPPGRDRSAMCRRHESDRGVPDVLPEGARRDRDAPRNRGRPLCADPPRAQDQGREVARFKRRDVSRSPSRWWSGSKRWAEKNGARLEDARPAMPDELSDRMQEGCEALWRSPTNSALAPRRGRRWWSF